MATLIRRAGTRIGGRSSCHYSVAVKSVNYRSMAAGQPYDTDMRFQPFERNTIRTTKLNRLADHVDEIRGDLDSIELTGAPDPGDLTVYYDNGKA